MDLNLRKLQNTCFFAVVVFTVDNYQKGKTVTEPLTKEAILIPYLPENFIWMQVSGGSKIRNLMGIAMKGFSEHGAVVWSGTGPAINKTISCAEILKRRFKPHQITKICYRRTEEFWDPILPDLDQLVVEREEPVIHIFLSRNPLNVDEPGYQAPGQNNPSFKSFQSGSGTFQENSLKKSRRKPFKTGSDRLNAPKFHNRPKPSPRPQP